MLAIPYQINRFLPARPLKNHCVSMSMYQKNIVYLSLCKCHSLSHKLYTIIRSTIMSPVSKYISVCLFVCLSSWLVKDIISCRNWLVSLWLLGVSVCEAICRVRLVIGGPGSIPGRDIFFQVSFIFCSFVCLFACVFICSLYLFIYLFIFHALKDTLF